MRCCYFYPYSAGAKDVDHFPEGSEMICTRAGPVACPVLSFKPSPRFRVCWVPPNQVFRPPVHPASRAGLEAVRGALRSPPNASTPTCLPTYLRFSKAILASRQLSAVCPPCLDGGRRDERGASQRGGVKREARGGPGWGLQEVPWLFQNESCNSIRSSPFRLLSTIVGRPARLGQPRPSPKGGLLEALCARQSCDQRENKGMD